MCVCVCVCVCVCACVRARACVCVYICMPYVELPGVLIFYVFILHITLMAYFEANFLLQDNEVLSDLIGVIKTGPDIPGARR